MRKSIPAHFLEPDGKKRDPSFVCDILYIQDNMYLALKTPIKGEKEIQFTHYMIYGTLKKAFSP
jgi:hypothetical protein